MAPKHDSLKAQLAEQAVLLADRSNENKHLHRELSRVAEVLDVKLNEMAEMREGLSVVTSELRQRESERDLLAVMLSEAETARTRDVAGSEHMAAEKFFHRVLNSLPVGIIELSPEGVIVSANRHLLDITGYSLVELFGKEVCVLFEKHKGNTLLLKKLSESRGVISEARIRRQDRTAFRASVVTKNITVLPHNGLLLCVLDLSEIRQQLNFD